MKVLRSDAGKSCLLRFDGEDKEYEAMILEVDHDNKWVKVFGFDDNVVSTEDFDQVICLGKPVAFPGFYTYQEAGQGK